MAYLSQQLIALRPGRMLDDDPRGVTVEASIIGEHSHKVFGMVGNITVTPGAGHYDHRADIAQFGRNTPGQQWPSLRLTCRAFGARAEDNRFKCLIRTCNMDFVDARVVAKIG